MLGLYCRYFPFEKVVLHFKLAMKHQCSYERERQYLVDGSLNHKAECSIVYAITINSLNGLRDLVFRHLVNFIEGSTMTDQQHNYEELQPIFPFEL